MEELIMHTDLIFNSNSPQTLARRLLVNVAASLILAVAQPTLAQTQQKTFASAEQASQALYEAVLNEDDRAVMGILGAAPELTSTGNDEEDKLDRERFAEKYREMHRLVREPDGFIVLYVGAENWPFPIPLIATDGKWHFDSESGSQEIMAREVGENESVAIEVCRTMSETNSRDTKSTTVDDSLVQFARNLLTPENARSPTSEPFHGYYFRVLKERSGEMMAVAYPTEYRISGVMTFVLSGGTLYQRDLGPQTATTAKKIDGKPNGKWISVKTPVSPRT
jgi:hypothetical protein